MRHVVHADQRERRATCAPARVQQGDDVADVALRAGGAVFEVGGDRGVIGAVAVFDGIAFFGDGQADHLQAGGGGDVAQVLEVIAHGQRFDDAGEDDFVQRAVAFEADEDAQVVAGAVGFFDDFRVEAFGDDDAAFGVALVEQALLRVGEEGAEDVARAEVQPAWRAEGRGAHARDVIERQLVTALLPPGFVLQGVQGEFHACPRAAFSHISHTPWMYMMPSARS